MFLITTAQFHERLDQLMEERKWNRRQLALHSGCPSSTIYNMIERKSEPLMSTFLKIVACFGMTVEEFAKTKTEGKGSLSEKELQISKELQTLDPEKLDQVLEFMKGLEKEM